jgi:hypothetical protein
VIVGQIHGPGGTPPLILCVNHTDLLTGRAVHLLHRRLRRSASPVGRARRGRPATQDPGVFDWPAFVLAERSGLYFKAGAYNKQEIKTAKTGTAIVRHHLLDLV